MSCSTDCRWCKAERGEFTPSLVSPSSLPEAPAFKPLPLAKHTPNVLVSPTGRIFINYREVAWPAKEVVVGSGVDWSLKERLAWKESEFADQEQHRPVLDGDPEDGFILVDEPVLHRDRATVRDLHRFDPDSPLIVDRDGNARGANPFSTDEGAAEWLHRARIELRFLYREARDDRQRSAIVAREAALRARHNARCYARCIARYFQLDEAQVLAVLDGRQKAEPIGWLGLEAAMKAIHASLAGDYQERLAAWNDEFRPAWDDEAKDAWLDRMPVEPEYPTQLVASSKKLRSYAKVVRETAAADVAEHWAEPMPTRAGTEVPVGAGFTPGQARFYAQVAERGGWWDVRREFELAEGLTPEQLDVPETLDFSAEVGGELDRLPRPARIPVSPLHRCGESCAVCGVAAA